MRSNLTFWQRTTLKELSQNTENKGYSYDKGNSFIILNNEDIIQNAEEQIGESTISNTGLTSKIQKQFTTFLKQKKFETRTYFQLYLLDPIPPTMCSYKYPQTWKLISHASYTFNNWYPTVSHFSRSDRIDSTYFK